MPLSPGGADEHRPRTAPTGPSPCAATVLVRALGQVRRDRQAELQAGRVELGRARVRGVRRDAEPDAAPTARRSTRSRVASNRVASVLGVLRRRPRGRRSPAGRARRRPWRRAPEKLASPTVVTPERRHSAAPSRAIASISAQPMRALRSMCMRSHGPNDEPVAEARVDRVLEVRVRVDEPRHDRRIREALALRRAPPACRPPRSGRPRSRPRRARSAAPSTGSTQSAERTAQSLGRAAASPLRRRVPSGVSMNVASQTETEVGAGAARPRTRARRGRPSAAGSAMTTTSTMPIRQFRRSWPP